MTDVTARDGTRLRVKVWGDGRPVVLLHGWPLSADSWDDQAMAIADAGYKAVTYDRRGFGRSDQPWTGYDYDTLTDDLADVMAATGADERATLVGFSMGGGEVARYMSRHGGKGVAQAALVSSVVPYLLRTDDNPHGVPEAEFGEMAGGMRDDRARFFGWFFDGVYGVDAVKKHVSPHVLEWSRTVAMQASLKATLACAEAFATTDFRPDLPHFKVPTLVIHGLEDRTVPIDATGRAAARGIENATLIEYENAPHALFDTHKRRLTDDLLAFLGSLDREN